MKTAAFCLLLLAALPCAAGNLWGSSVIWGSSVVWADATPSGQSVIWGSSVVWADTFTGGGEQTTVLGER
jgi:hypothetical protein